MTHFSDNSRYIAGFACPFLRLCHYHLLGTGYVPLTEPIETFVGHQLHTLIEHVVNHSSPHPTKSEVSSLLPLLPSPTDSLVASEIYGLIHGWCRTVLPWLRSSYEILSIEQEFTLDLGDSISWMARPDFVLRRRSDSGLVIADLKTTRSKADRVASINISSLQTIMNSYAASQHYGEPIVEVQIHALQLGTPTWPTSITHAYYRAAQSPYVTEDWQPRSRRPDGTWLGKLYRRVQVHEHIPIADWVWRMPPDVLKECLPLAIHDTDIMVQGLKVIEALASIRKNESQWRDLLSKIDWSTATYSDLTNLVPRTFSCIQYNRDCDYMPICFNPLLHTEPVSSPSSKDVLSLILTPRVPHHPQEVQ